MSPGRDKVPMPSTCPLPIHPRHRSCPWASCPPYHLPKLGMHGRAKVLLARLGGRQGSWPGVTHWWPRAAGYGRDPGTPGSNQATVLPQPGSRGPGEGAEVGSPSWPHRACPVPRQAPCPLPTWGTGQGLCAMASSSFGRAGLSHLTCVLGTGQGQSQGPERGHFPPADGHGVECGERSPRHRL